MSKVDPQTPPTDTAFDDLFLELLRELKAIAAALRRSSGSATLSTMDIVNEAFLKLRPSLGNNFNDPIHFKRSVALAMRHLLTDRARYHNAEVHGGRLEFLALDENIALPNIPIERYLDLDRALHDLADVDPLQAEVITLRFYGGFTAREISQLVSLSIATVDRRLAAAVAWLRLWYEGKLPSGAPL